MKKWKISLLTRKEDVKVTLFFQIDKNMPEKLVEYLIWFNQSNETATVIAKNENSYGTVNKENTQTLKEIVLNNNNNITKRKD